MSLSRRAFTSAGAAAAAGLALPVVVRAQPARTRLIILGSLAGPSVGAARHQASNLLVHGDDAYVVDCGYGATEQFVHARAAPFRNLRDIFITHHHPDHDIELGTFVYFAWYAGLETPLGLYGPPPLQRIWDGHRQAIQPDVDVWLKDIGHKPLPPITVHEVSGAGPVMQDAKVRVTSAVVHHPPVVPALAYRFDFPDRSVVFSGDTTPSDNLIALARGADVLVHEAIYVQGIGQGPAAGAGSAPVNTSGGSPIAGDPAKLRAHVLGSHTTAEQAGQVAAAAGVKTLVLSHLAPGGPEISDEMWRSAAAKAFKGQIIVAHDLMEI